MGAASDSYLTPWELRLTQFSVEALMLFVHEHDWILELQTNTAQLAVQVIHVTLFDTM